MKITFLSLLALLLPAPVHASPRGSWERRRSPSKPTPLVANAFLLKKPTPHHLPKSHRSPAQLQAELDSLSRAYKKLSDEHLRVTLENTRLRNQAQQDNVRLQRENIRLQAEIIRLRTEKIKSKTRLIGPR